MAKSLTPKMQEALRYIVSEPGTLVEEVPGRRQTIDALMRRGLAELDWDGLRVFPPEHEHRFQQTMHMDGCHWFTSSYRCECGAQAQTSNERSPSQDPYSMVWMDPEGREPCSRCEDLIDGARPKASVVIVRPRVQVPA